MRQVVEDADVHSPRRHGRRRPRAGPLGGGLGGLHRARGDADGAGPADGGQVRRDRGARDHGGRDDLRRQPAGRGDRRVADRGAGRPARGDRADRGRRVAVPARGARVCGDRRPGAGARQRGAEPDLCRDRGADDHHRAPEPGSVDPGLHRHRPHAGEAFRRRRLDRGGKVDGGGLDPVEDGRCAAGPARADARRAQRVPGRLRGRGPTSSAPRTCGCRSGCSTSRRR